MNIILLIALLFFTSSVSAGDSVPVVAEFSKEIANTSDVAFEKNVQAMKSQHIVSIARVTTEDTRRVRYHFDFFIKSRPKSGFKIVSMRLYDGSEVTQLLDQLGAVDYWFPKDSDNNSREAMHLKKDQEFRMYFLKPDDDHCQNIALESKDRKFRWISKTTNCPKISYFSELRYFSKYPVGVGSLEGSDTIVEGVPITSSQHGPNQNLIPKQKKKLIKPSMTVRQAVGILGPGYVAKSSGTGGVTWYFDDHTDIGYPLWTELDAVPNWRLD